MPSARDRQLAQRARRRFTERETKRELCQVSKAIRPFSDMIRTSGTKSEAGTAQGFKALVTGLSESLTSPLLPSENDDRRRGT